MKQTLIKEETPEPEPKLEPKPVQILDIEVVPKPPKLVRQTNKIPQKNGSNTRYDTAA